MLETLRSLWPGTSTVVHECRHCGQTVEAGTERCPNCGTGGIASYRVE